MLINYFKIAWRNLFANKASSVINIVGLSAGMAVVMVIGLWIWDELSFDRYHVNHDRIAQVMERDNHNGVVYTSAVIPLPLDAELRKSYGSDFKHIVMASFTENHTLSVGDKKLTYPGNFIGAEAPEMLSLQMLSGTRNGLAGPSSMLISASVAKAIFAATDPINKTITLDNKVGFKVAGVYQDLPANTTLHEVAFMAPWDFYVNAKDWLQRDAADWTDNSLFMYVQIGDNVNMDKLSQKIKNIKTSHDVSAAQTKPEIFLHPMNKWHLYAEFRNGINNGGAIQYVWLFGIIGLFVLLLACINFMNLSTARSEKRAKEVGIRKAIGSLRSQLVGQFYCESMLMSLFAFICSLLLVILLMPFFNEVAGKKISIPWANFFFWMTGVGFALFTGLIAGSYPALYLSSFKPVSILKGVFKGGTTTVLPRKVLVITQFTASIVLIVGTIVVFKQIQFAKDRPVGYSRDGLINITSGTEDLHTHFSALQNDLIKSGLVAGIAESSSPTTGVNNNRRDVDWAGKDPDMVADFANIAVSSGYGVTVGWQFMNGRDFTEGSTADSLSVVINEAAVKYTGLKNPIGEKMKIGKRYLTVVGVVKDMVMASPYEPVKQSLFYLGRGPFDDVILKIAPHATVQQALTGIEEIYKTYAPSVPFSYKFVDEEYARKFAGEVRVGRLGGFFTILALLISCLGLFGMASFMAEQRTREIGIRKVLGASVFNLWRLLSGEFIWLIGISIGIAVPVSYYFMHHWLQNYQYHTGLSWWIFSATAVGTLALILLTVSFQAVKAALANPVKSLRTE